MISISTLIPACRRRWVGLASTLLLAAAAPLPTWAQVSYINPAGFIGTGESVMNPTPWSGGYFTPGQGGSGWMLDFSADGTFFFATFYSYDALGNPGWFTMQAGDGSGPACVPKSWQEQSLTHQVCTLTGTINRFMGGQAFGGPFVAPIAEVGALGTGSITFDDSLNHAEFRGTSGNGPVVIPLVRLFDSVLPNNASGNDAPGFVGTWKVYDLLQRKACPTCAKTLVRQWVGTAVVAPRVGEPHHLYMGHYSSPPAAGTAIRDPHVPLPDLSVPQYSVTCTDSGIEFPFTFGSSPCPGLRNADDGFLYQEPDTGVLRGLTVCLGPANDPGCRRLPFVGPGGIPFGTPETAIELRHTVFLSQDGAQMLVRSVAPSETDPGAMRFRLETLWVRQSPNPHQAIADAPLQ